MHGSGKIRGSGERMATEGVRTPKKRAATESARRGNGGRATPKKRAAIKEPPRRRMRSEKIRRKTRGTREQKHGDALRRGDTDKTAAREYGQNEITEAMMYRDL